MTPKQLNSIHIKWFVQNIAMATLSICIFFLVIWMINILLPHANNPDEVDLIGYAAALCGGVILFSIAYFHFVESKKTAYRVRIYSESEDTDYNLKVLKSELRHIHAVDSQSITIIIWCVDYSAARKEVEKLQQFGGLKANSEDISFGIISFN